MLPHLHAFLYSHLRRRIEQESLLYLRFFPAIFNAQSGLRDKQSPFESRGRRAVGTLPNPYLIPRAGPFRGRS
jgi:hypothetical protein